MSFIQNLFTSRDNNANSVTYVGQQDRIWWDPVTNAFYYSDGNTAGGIPVGLSGSGNGIPGGAANTVQYNAGAGTFGGNVFLTINPANGNLSATGNIVAGYLYGDGYNITNIQADNIVGNIAVGNITITDVANLGNLTITDQTISGTVANRDITLNPVGTGNLAVWANLVVTPDGVDPSYPPNDGVNKPIAWLAGQDGKSSIVYIDSHSNDNPGGSPNLSFRRFSGTKAAPTAVTSGQYLGSFLARGFDGTSFQTAAYSGLIFTATQNFSPTQQGTSLEIRTIATGANTATTVATFNNESVTIGDFVFQDDSITVANTAANITIGTVGSTGNLQSLRPFQVISNASGAVAFEVARSGKTDVYAPGLASGDTALNIINTADGLEYPVAAPVGGYSLRATGAYNQATLVGLDTFSNNVGNPSVISGRRFRGTVSSPSAVQAGDNILLFNASGYNSANVRTGISSARIVFTAAENFTTAQQSANIAVQMLRKGTLTQVTSATFEDNGLHIPDALSGITFQDGSFQNTAYLTNNVVNNLTAGAGINLSGATGNVTVTNTGILGVVGTPNRVLVTSNVAGVVTLSTPQDLNSTANVSFNTLTVANLIVTGNISNVIPSIVEGKVIYVANTATTYNDIDQSGLLSGNIANGYAAAILYQTSSNTWTFDYGNSWGITANTVYGNSAFYNDFIHVGYANATVEYGNASVQADSNIDNFSQIVQQNHFQGANASSDFVAVANNGDEEIYYIDMGINSNVYNNSDYAVTGPNDGYLYVNGGDLVVGTQTPTDVIKFFTGGTDSTNKIRVVINDAGISVAGNISSNNMVATSYTGELFSVTGNITGGNLLTSGVLSTTGTITGSSIFGGVVSATGTITGGNMFTAGTVSATGNIRGGNIITANLISSGSLSTAGNITGGNLLSISNVSASGNVTATYVIAQVSTETVNLNATGTMSATGNITGGNLRTVGNVTGNYFIGNGSQLTGLNAYGNVYANGTAVLAGNGSATLSVTPGNNQVITGNNSSKTVTIAVNDNPTFATLSVTGNITVSGNVNAANTSYTNVANITMSNTAPLGNAYPGVMEYDGRVLYFTPQDSERGVTPSQQWYVLNSDRGLTYGAVTPQSLFGVGAHVSNGTRYWFRIKAFVSRGAGTNNTALTLGWRGSAVLTRINFSVQSTIGTFATVKAAYTYENTLVANFTDQLTVTNANNPPDNTNIIITGVIDVGLTGAGTVDPYISWTGATPAGSVTVSADSNFQIYPLGVVGSNTVVGNWS